QPGGEQMEKLVVLHHFSQHYQHDGQDGEDSPKSQSATTPSSHEAKRRGRITGQGSCCMSVCVRHRISILMRLALTWHLRYPQAPRYARPSLPASSLAQLGRSGCLRSPARIADIGWHQVW